MRKRLAVTIVLGVLAGGCQKPIVEWTCTACKALLDSGVCNASAAGAPKCEAGEVLVIENWKEMKKGAEPVFGCERR